jgi:hypothetical protein
MNQARSKLKKKWYRENLLYYFGNLAYLGWFGIYKVFGDKNKP